MLQSSVQAIFAQHPRSFRLTVDAIARLEMRCGAGVGAIYQRLAAGTFYQADVWDTIRFGLYGAGMAEDAALQLVASVNEARDARIGAYVQLAADILTAHFYGLDQAALALERLQLDEKKTPGEGDLLLPDPPPPATSPIGPG